MNLEIEQKKRRGGKTVRPFFVNDVEDSRCFAKLLARLNEELKPRTAIEEGDLISLAQMRWSAERANHLIQCEVNQRVRSPLMQTKASASVRLLMAYRMCLGDRSFNLLVKQHLDTVKAMQTLSARVEKWSAAKDRSAK